MTDTGSTSWMGSKSSPPYVFRLHCHTLTSYIAAFLLFFYTIGIMVTCTWAITMHREESRTTIAQALLAAIAPFLSHFLLVVGNRFHIRFLYIPALLYNCFWSFDQTCESLRKAWTQIGALTDVRGLFNFFAQPFASDSVNSNVDDLLFALLRPFIAFFVLGLIFCDYDYLRTVGEVRVAPVELQQLTRKKTDNAETPQLSPA